MREPKRAVFLLSLFVLTLFSASLGDAYAQDSSSVGRISVEDARSRVLAGKAFLVCAYNEERCSGMMLEGAVTKTQFEKKLPTLSKDQEIITYCSWNAEATSASLAAEYQKKGFRSVKALKGGVAAWLDKNYPVVKK